MWVWQSVWQLVLQKETLSAMPTAWPTAQLWVTRWVSQTDSSLARRLASLWGLRMVQPSVLRMGKKSVTLLG